MHVLREDAAFLFSPCPFNVFFLQFFLFFHRFYLLHEQEMITHPEVKPWSELKNSIIPPLPLY